jgi:hypothetical protein
LFATLAAGGKDGEGQFPDFKRDGKVSFSEMARLARSDGNGASINPDDFKAAFPDRFQEGGVAVDSRRLEQIANDGRGNPFENSVPFPGSGNPFGGFLPGLFQAMMFMMQRLAGSGGGGQGGFFFFLFGRGNPTQ